MAEDAVAVDADGARVRPAGRVLRVADADDDVAGDPRDARDLLAVAAQRRRRRARHGRARDVRLVEVAAERRLGQHDERGAALARVGDDPLAPASMQSCEVAPEARGDGHDGGRLAGSSRAHLVQIGPRRGCAVWPLSRNSALRLRHPGPAPYPADFAARRRRPPDRGVRGPTHGGNCLVSGRRRARATPGHRALQMPRDRQPAQRAALDAFDNAITKAITKGPATWQQLITPQDIEATVIENLVAFGADADDVTRDATLEAIDVDSLDLVELTQVVEETYAHRPRRRGLQERSRRSATSSTSSSRASRGDLARRRHHRGRGRHAAGRRRTDAARALDRRQHPASATARRRARTSIRPTTCRPSRRAARTARRSLRSPPAPRRSRTPAGRTACPTTPS